MATLQPIGEQRKATAEKILNLTLQIIRLLEGEDYIVFMISSGSRPASLRKTLRPVAPLTTRCDQKILEVTNKIAELLSAEHGDDSPTDDASAQPEECVISIKEEIKEEVSWMEDWGCLAAQEQEDQLTSLGDLHGGDASELRIIISGDCDVKNDEVTSHSSEESPLTTLIREDHGPEDPHRNRPNTRNLLSKPPGSDASLHPSAQLSDPSLSNTHPSDNDTLQSSGSDLTRKRPFSCTECGKCFAVKSVLSKHQRRHTEEKPYSCPECGKSFVLKHDLTRHQRRHTGEKPYLCSVCWKDFFSKAELTRHQTTHSKEKPFACPHCEGSFTRREHLILHIRSHTGEKPYACAECGKTFSYKSNLVTHERTHRGEKPFVCPECGKCISSKFNLLLHQRAHRGEKPYSCTECGKCFTKTTNLLSHLQTHNGGKPFSCPVCGKCFSRKMDLLRHNRIHGEGKPCSCSQCEECVSRREALLNFQVGNNDAGSYGLPEVLGPPENRA